MMYECPHCGKDKRSLDEIVESIKDFDKLDESRIDEFDSVSLINDIDAALKLSEVKSDPIRTAKLQASKKILEEYGDVFEQYDSTKDDDERGFYADELVVIQKKLNVELPELISELSNY